MSEDISTNSGIHDQFRIYYKRGKASQLWVSSCSAQIQWVASGKKSAFWSLPLLSQRSLLNQDKINAVRGPTRNKTLA